MGDSQIKKSILCTICARSGSKGMPAKNVTVLQGKPLIVHTIEAAKSSGLFDEIVVSSDGDDILEIAKKNGADVFFKRDSALAGDKIGKLDVIRDAFVKSEVQFNKKYDYLIDLDVTSPLRKPEDIVNAFEKLVHYDYDNLITGSPSRRSPYFNLVELNKDGYVELSKNSEVLRRQDSPNTFDMNASIYIWKRKAILEHSKLFVQKTGLYEMPFERSLDIDCEVDFKLVEFMMKEGLNA